MAKGPASKSASSSSKAEGGEAKKVSKKKSKASTSSQKVSFRSYIRKILKNIDEKLSLDETALRTLQGMIMDFLTRLFREAKELTQRDNRKQMTVRDHKTALRLMQGGELREHADAEGAKACTKYLQTIEKKSK